MPLLTLLLPPLHLLTFSALLGSQLYQTFVVTKVAFSTLPGPAYTSFQKRIFPIYFAGQSLLLLFVVVSVPPLGPVSLVAEKATWIPLAVSGAVALVNWGVYGPRTRRLMLDRVEQGMLSSWIEGCVKADGGIGRVDAKTMGLQGPSAEMGVLKKRFSRAHAMCIHLNLVGMGALLFYGWRLGSRLQF